MIFNDMLPDNIYANQIKIQYHANEKIPDNLPNLSQNKYLDIMYETIVQWDYLRSERLEMIFGVNRMQTPGYGITPFAWVVELIVKLKHILLYSSMPISFHCNEEAIDHAANRDKIINMLAKQFVIHNSIHGINSLKLEACNIIKEK